VRDSACAFKAKHPRSNSSNRESDPVEILSFIIAIIDMLAGFFLLIPFTA
jgi:hypothetical protein